MANNHWAGNDHGNSWGSNKPSLSYKLQSASHKRSPLMGFRGPVDQIKLTDKGRQFMAKMFEKFNVGDTTGPEANTSYYIILRHIISYHIISYHIISYHIIS